MASIIAASETAAYWKLTKLREMNRTEDGAIIKLLDQIIALFAAIKNGAGERSVENLATDVYCTFFALHSILKSDPFNNPLDKNAIEEIGLELMQLRADAKSQEELLAEYIRMESELATLNSAKTRIAELETKILQLEQRQIDTASAETTKKLQEALDQANQRYESLSSALQKAMEHVAPFLPPKEKPISVLPVLPVQPVLGFCGEIEKVKTAIERWTNWLEEIDTRANTLQEELEEYDRKIEELEQVARFGGTPMNGSAKNIQSQKNAVLREQRRLVDLNREGREQLLKLRQVAEMANLLQSGISDDLLVPPTVSEQKETAPVVVKTSSDTATSATDYCHAVSERTGLQIARILQLSLFDLVPKDEKGRNQLRGNNRILRTALDLSMLQPFGIDSLSDFFRELPTNERETKDPYLIFSGAAQGALVMRRTKTPLPWDPNLLFQKNTVEVFRVMLAEKSQPPERR